MSDKEEEGAKGPEEQTGQKRGRGRPRKPKPDQVIYILFFYVFIVTLKILAISMLRSFP